MARECYACRVCAELRQHRAEMLRVTRLFEYFEFFIFLCVLKTFISMCRIWALITPQTMIPYHCKTLNGRSTAHSETTQLFKTSGSLHGPTCGWHKPLLVHTYCAGCSEWTASAGLTYREFQSLTGLRPPLFV